MPRFILLEHVGSPDDPVGRHYDLLLEEGDACPTWRLAAIPTAAGEPVAAMPIAPHRLAWLDHIDGPVSGNRGHARRVDAGTFTWIDAAEVSPAGIVRVRLVGGSLRGDLTISSSHAVIGRMDPAHGQASIIPQPPR